MHTRKKQKKQKCLYEWSIRKETVRGNKLKKQVAAQKSDSHLLV